VSKQPCRQCERLRALVARLQLRWRIGRIARNVRKHDGFLTCEACGNYTRRIKGRCEACGADQSKRDQVQPA
jgi:hypothetical protein